MSSRRDFDPSFNLSTVSLICFICSSSLTMASRGAPSTRTSTVKWVFVQQKLRYLASVSRCCLSTDCLVYRPYFPCLHLAPRCPRQFSRVLTLLLRVSSTRLCERWGILLIRHCAVEHRKVNMGRASKGLCLKVRPLERKEKQMKWVRENLCLWSVSSAARNET